MAKKVPAYSFWDWKTVFAIVVVIIIFLLFIFMKYFKPISKNWKLKAYQGITTGQIDEVDTLTRIVQNYEGNHVVHTYAISYIYTVDGNKYKGFEKVKKDIKTHLYLRKLISGQKNFMIKYDRENPEKSVIMIE